MHFERMKHAKTPLTVELRSQQTSKKLKTMARYKVAKFHVNQNIGSGKNATTKKI